MGIVFATDLLELFAEPDPDDAYETLSELEALEL